jgi:glycosyltransferase involved in cell wall biosynthesis
LIALRRKYDIVHVFQIQLAAFVAVVLGKRLGKRVVVSSRCAGAAGDMAVWSSIPGGSRLLKTVCAGVDAATAVSTEVRDELLRAGFNSERTYYIPNGVPLSPPTIKTKSMFRRRLGLPQDRFIALFVGRLAEQKAPEFLIEAWKGVIDNHPASRLIFLGDGEKRSELEAEVRTAGMEDFIHFAGRVDDVESYLHAADLFVLPSVTEGMSMALLEAMANRLPVVASRVSGTSDILRHEENGLLFESGDRDGLTAAISSLIESPKRREELGQRARETVEKDYALDKAVDRYYRLYDSLL